MPLGSAMSDRGWSGIGQVPELSGVEACRRVRPVSSQKKAPADEHALVGPEERVELPGQPALGNGEGEPAGLGPVRIVAGRRMELVVRVVLGHLAPLCAISSIGRPRRQIDRRKS